MKKVLIVCTGNSCRSQMAEGWIREFTFDKVQVFSAGTHPEEVNPFAIKVMQMECIDIAHHESNLVDDYLNINLDYVITVCDDANENCPHLSLTAKKIHKSFPDPAKAKGDKTQVILAYMKVRDMLKGFCKDFVQNELGISVNKKIITRNFHCRGDL